MRIKTVYIEITNRCNLNCCTCYNRSGANRETKELSVNQIKEIVDIFSKYGARRFLFSGGEPSLHSEFNSLIQWIDAHPDLSFGFVTNGSSRNPAFIDLLNRSPNVTLQISLDGSCEEYNAKTRGSGHFNSAIEFARSISNPTQRPLLKMVVSQKNLFDVENFYRLAISINCIPEFAFIYKSGNASDEWERKKVSAQDKIKILNKIKALNIEYSTDAFLPRCTSVCPFSKGDEQMSICIKVDGSIQPCQALYSSSYTLGNALRFNPLEVSENLENLCEIARQRTNMDFGCSKCMLDPICKRGCMAEAINLTGDPLGNDDACLYRKLQFLHHDMKEMTI